MFSCGALKEGLAAGRWERRGWGELGKESGEEEEEGLGGGEEGRRAPGEPGAGSGSGG